MDCYILGTSNQKFTVQLGPVNRSFRGRKEFGQGSTLQCTFVETTDLSTLTALRQWQEYIVGTNSGSSQGYISSYATTPTITVYDTTGSISDSVQVFRCFPDNLPDIQLSTQSAQPVVVQCSFSFDYLTYQGVSVT